MEQYTRLAEGTVIRVDRLVADIGRTVEVLSQIEFLAGSYQLPPATPGGFISGGTNNPSPSAVTA